MRERYLNDPDRLIDLAEEMRTTAEGPWSLETRRSLTYLAEQYYRLAEMAQRRREFAQREEIRRKDVAANG